jgi:hypothetical protein
MREARPAVDNPAGGGEAARFFNALGPGWLLTAGQRSRLAPAVADAVTAGWAPDDLAAFAGANSAGVRSPYAVLAARLSPAELPPPRAPDAPRRKPWCGRCDPGTRFLLDENGYPGDSPQRCPDCSSQPAPVSSRRTAGNPGGRQSERARERESALPAASGEGGDFG